MKHLWLHFVMIVCCIIGAFVVLGLIGDYDYTSQVVYTMSYEDYMETRDLLTEQNGTEPSEREIAHYWQEHHN